MKKALESDVRRETFCPGPKDHPRSGPLAPSILPHLPVLRRSGRKGGRSRPASNDITLRLTATEQAECQPRPAQISKVPRVRSCVPHSHAEGCLPSCSRLPSGPHMLQLLSLTTRSRSLSAVRRFSCSKLCSAMRTHTRTLVQLKAPSWRKDGLAKW